MHDPVAVKVVAFPAVQSGSGRGSGSGSGWAEAAWRELQVHRTLQTLAVEQEKHLCV